MRRANVLLALFLCGVSFPFSTVNAGAWLTYRNARFGTIANVPASGFLAQPPSQNGDGRVWISSDGLGQILVFGDLVVTVDTMAAYRREILGYARDDGLDVVYSAARRNWFAYSGYLGGDIVYEKVVITPDCAPMIANHLYLRYPISQKKRYDPIVRRMAASLGGNSAAPMCN